MATGPLHATLTAATVKTLTLDLPDAKAANLSFNATTAPRVEVLNVDGAASVYFTTNGIDPTVGGDGCHVLPAAIGAVEVYDETPGPTSTIKLISAGAPRVSVRAA